MKNYSIRLRGIEVATLSCAEVVEKKDSVGYVVRTEDGKLVAILTPAPGITIEEKEKT